jgi:hypothetical protein
MAFSAGRLRVRGKLQRDGYGTYDGLEDPGLLVGSAMSSEFGGLG